ncbi:MAG TPA: helix-turn-helix domain-containing protein [Candidatus Limnocylindrales bacterium]|nr:helix-turn-helix domain-containing protein [Candidatus Limnocylindrales bacterium]
MADAQQPAAGSPDEIAPPDAERLISDVETLKAISDPLRLRILELMVTRPSSAWSVKELAAGLDVPPTRLYHHIELLVERDLLRSAEQRVVSGIIETRYRMAALSLRLDPSLVRGGGAGHSAAREMLTTIFDESRRDLEAILAHPNLGDEPPLDRPFVIRSLARLTPDRARELRSRIEALLGEYDPQDLDDPGPAGASTYRLLIALYASPSKEASRD